MLISVLSQNGKGFLDGKKPYTANCCICLLCNRHMIMLPILLGEANIFIPPLHPAATYNRGTDHLMDTHLKHTPSSPHILASWPFLSGFSLWLNKCISLCHETTSLAANKEHERRKCSRRCGRKIGILTSMIDMRICPKVVLFAEI